MDTRVKAVGFEAIMALHAHGLVELISAGLGILACVGSRGVAVGVGAVQHDKVREAEVACVCEMGV